MSKMLSLMSKLHYRYAYAPRIEALASLFAKRLFPTDHVLDLGCGGGILGATLANKVPGLRVEGIETRPRGNELIPVHSYDGENLPFDNDSFDVIVVADVLHHVKAPINVLMECARVARRSVIVKDHLRKGYFSYLRICVLDWAANAPYGVPLLYRYWSHAEWMQMFGKGCLQVESIVNPMKLYHWSLNVIFGGTIHFVAFTKPACKSTI